jgi:pimeloyl-ACP methyl ester carboxylesterase
MGINEAQDLKKVVAFLRERYGISQFGLWGRSMGAVTAIIYASLEPQRVSKMVLDSPFSNFRQLVKEIVNSKTGLPDFLFGSIIDKIEE